MVQAWGWQADTAHPRVPARACSGEQPRFSSSSSGNGFVTAFPGQALPTLTPLWPDPGRVVAGNLGETHSGQLPKNTNPLTAPPDAAREARTAGAAGALLWRCPRAARGLVRLPSGAGSPQGCGHRMDIGWGMRVETTASQWSRQRGADPDVRSGWSTRCLGAESAGGGATSLGYDRARCLPGPSQRSARHRAQVGLGYHGSGTDLHHQAAFPSGGSRPVCTKATVAQCAGLPAGAPRPVMSSQETDPTGPHASEGPWASHSNAEPVTRPKAPARRAPGRVT